MTKELPSYQIIFENESILIFSKPTEVHSTSGKSDSHTITDFLKKSYPNNFTINDEGGTLQRLDFETSGCLLIAKSSNAFNFFKEQIKNHQLVKEYYFLTDQKLVTSLRAKHYLYSRYRGSKKINISEQEVPRSLYAETVFTPEKELVKDRIYLIKASTRYGRRHQVRAQAGASGIPLIGDELYGSETNFLKLGLQGFPKFLLHGVNLKIPQNPFCEKTDFSAPLPDYLAEFINNPYPI